MRQSNIGRRTIWKHHVAHETGEVGVIFSEVADVAFSRVREDTSRCALATPIQHRHREATPPQVSDDLEIFLDEFAAPGEHACCAAAGRARRFPACEAQFGPVIAREFTNDGAARDRVPGQRYELHGLGSASGRLCGCGSARVAPHVVARALDVARANDAPRGRLNYAACNALKSILFTCADSISRNASSL